MIVVEDSDQQLVAWSSPDEDGYVYASGEFRGYRIIMEAGPGRWAVEAINMHRSGAADSLEEAKTAAAGSLAAALLLCTVGDGRSVQDRP
jgi:hypothetical protein